MPKGSNGNVPFAPIVVCPVSGRECGRAPSRRLVCDCASSVRRVLASDDTRAIMSVMSSLGFPDIFVGLALLLVPPSLLACIAYLIGRIWDSRTLRLRGR